MFKIVCCDPLVRYEIHSQGLEQHSKNMEENRIERQISVYIAYSKAMFIKCVHFVKGLRVLYWFTNYNAFLTEF